MTKNPFINAVSASAYIIIVALVMNYAERFASHPDTILAPIAFLSLFTLSAAMMGYLFLYQPAQLFLEGDKKGGAALFVKTLAIFAVLTAVALFSALYFASTLPIAM